MSSFFKQEGRRYIVGTPMGMLKRFERELLAQDWKQVHAGLEVRLCSAQEGAGVFILCRSAQRTEKERAMHERFEKRIEAGLTKIAAGCKKRKQKAGVIERRVGQLRGEDAGGGAVCVIVEPRDDGFVRFLDAERCLAGVGAAERGLLSAAEQRDGLEPGGVMAGLHSTDRSGGSVSDS
jgi:hypothetical protein